MSIKKNWDTADIANQIRSISRECSSPYNDGFVSFGFKKDLYQIKFLIDEVLKNSPTFGQTEQEWLTEQEKQRIIKILKS